MARVTTIWAASVFLVSTAFADPTIVSDVAEFQAAVSRANASGSGRIVLLPGQIYTFTDSGLPTIASSIEVDGRGAVITVAPSAQFGTLIEIDATGALTMTDLRLTGIAPAEPFGIITNEGSLILKRATIDGNGDDQSDIFAVVTNRGLARLENVTLANNHTFGIGGAAAAFTSVGGMAELSNVTIVGNAATFSDRLVANFFPDNAGISIRQSEVSISNSVIQNEHTECDIDGKLDDLGGNIVADDSCGLSRALITSEAATREIREGSGVPVRVPIPGGPAIDAGVREFCPLLDGRSMRRDLQDPSSACDSGAAELVAADLSDELVGRFNGLYYVPSGGPQLIAVLEVRPLEVVLLWLAVDSDGAATWVLGQGERVGAHLDAEAWTVSDGDVVPWGRVQLVLPSCTTGEFSFDSLAEAPGQEALSVIRLAVVAGLGCPA